MPGVPRHPDWRLVAQIKVIRDGDERRGSGYRISNDLVVTAAHNLAGARSVEVRFYQGPHVREAHPAVEVWSDPRLDVDLALLRIPRADGEPYRTGFARLPSDVVTVECQVLGFPRFKLRAEGERSFRDMAAFPAMIHTAANTASGSFEVTGFVPPAAATRNADDPWESMSGAAVFADGRIVGLITRHYGDEGAGRLYGIPVPGWYATGPERLPALRELIGLPERIGALPVAAAADRPARPRGAGTVVTHPARMRHADRLLTGERLRYVPPAPGSPAAPGAILERLSRPDCRGLLLVGAPATGKTRTCLEVADLADRQDWLVLHARTDGDIQIADLERVLADDPPGARILVVLDKAAAMPSARLQELAYWADDRASAGPDDDGGQIRFLFTSRPQAVRELHRADAARLISREVTLDWRDRRQHDQVIEAVLDAVAPTAVQVNGRARLREYCGEDPLMAQLLARNAEELAERNRTVDVAEGLRLTLRGFLIARLERDRLLPGEDALPGIAAALTATPATTADLSGTVRHATGENAETIIRRLRRLGWLRGDDGELVAFHDAVVDEILEACLFPGEDGTLDSAALHGLLDAHLAGAGPLGLQHGVQHVHRLYESADEEQRREIGEEARRWLAANAVPLGGMLTTTHHAAGLLITLLQTGPWHDAVVEQWTTLTGAWFRSGGNPLLVLLRGTAPGYAGPVIGTALTLLERRDGGWAKVLVALLKRTDLTPAEAGRATVAARAVLGDRIHPRERTTVLEALIRRSDLDGVTLARTVAAALDHARRNRKWPQTGFLLDALAGRAGLSTADGDAAVAEALAWLAANDGQASRTVPVTMLFTRLLDRRELPEQHRTVLGQRLAVWIEGNGERSVASFILQRWLAAQPADGPEVAAVLAAAVRWVLLHRYLPRAMYLLIDALQRRELTPGQAGDLAGAGLDWLAARRPGDAAGANSDRVLRALLSRHDLGADLTATVVARSIAWLERFHRTVPAGYVLQAVLVRSDLSAPDTELALGWADTWLALRPDHPAARYVLLGKLERIRSGGGSAEAVVAELLGRAQPAEVSTGHVLRTLLEPGLRLPAPVRAEVREIALAWIDRYTDRLIAADVLTGLLGSPLEPQVRGEVLRRTLLWLAAYRTEHVAGGVLSAIKPGQLDGTAEEYERYAFAWLERHGGTVHAIRVVEVLAQILPPRSPQVATLLTLTTDWLTRHPEGGAVMFAFKQLLLREDLPAASVPAFAAAVLDRLRARPEQLWVEPELLGSVLQKLLILCRIGKLSIGPEVRAFALDRLPIFVRRADAAYVLSELLRNRCGPEVVNRAREYADDWLLRYDRHEVAYLVHEQLLKSLHLPEADAPAHLGAALRWLDLHHRAPMANLVLQPLIARPDLHTDVTATVVDQALAWLESHPASPRAGYLLREILGRRNLRQAQVARTVEHALSWLERRLRPGHRPTRPNQRRRAAPSAKPTEQWLLRNVLRAKSLTAEQRSLAEKLAVAWLRDAGGDADTAIVLQDLFQQAPRNSPSVPEALAHTRSWITRYPDSEHAPKVLRSLLLRQDLSTEELRPGVEDAYRWLRRHGSEVPASTLLRALPGNPGITAEERQRALAAIEAWLAANPDDPDVPVLLGAVLSSARVGAALRAEYAGLLLTWLGTEPRISSFEANAAVQGLLGWEDLGPADLRATLDAASAWLRRWPRPAVTAAFVWHAILCRTDLGASAAPLITEALDWCRRFRSDLNASRALVTLLHRPELAGAELGQAADLGLRWLSAFGGRGRAVFLLYALLCRDDLPEEAAGPAVRIAREWLGAHHPDLAAEIPEPPAGRRMITETLGGLIDPPRAILN
ncbi:serine protease [Actinoplanes sp. NPDC051851]|uniref:serine protease n=1 Tax=Actinoplanes sp. NPDC051851 TaxID=3154753 RepID=UPI0034404ECB